MNTDPKPRIKRELARIRKALRGNTTAPAMHPELMAAQQALEWVLDPKAAMAPFKYIVTL